MALALYAATLFVSAFILFLVQPMIGKMILPKLGGTPQVWNTCMMFFQIVLLAGYAYTHLLTTRLTLKKQLIVHLVLLALPLLVLLPTPFNVADWTPPMGSNPIWSTLALLAVVVGLPFLVVSTSAPLLQRWFGATGHPSAQDPYFLYGASNLGSLLSLLCYPFVVEPWLILDDQAWVWVAGYVVLGVMMAACVYVAFQSVRGRLLPERSAAVRKTEPVHRPPSAEVTLARRLRWILLAAIPTSLMLGVTTYVSTDLAPFPLLWAIPLALYLLTFVLVFSKWPVPWTDAPHQAVLFISPAFLLVLCFILFQEGFSPFLPTVLSFLGFFATALLCHGELARDRPATEHLTEYFLLMSVGGAVGGVVNALAAPLIFTTGVVEYPLAILLACFVRPRLANPWPDKLFKQSAPSSVGLHYTLDLALPLLLLGLAYLIRTNIGEINRYFGNVQGRTIVNENIHNYLLHLPPLVMAFFLASRPLRFGLAVAALMLMFLVWPLREEIVLYKDRSYFGVMRVLKGGSLDPRKANPVYTYLLHGTTIHGRCYKHPDIERLATTYYHRFGPMGKIMERYYWFSPAHNKTKPRAVADADLLNFSADARMPAALVGMIACPMGVGTLPLDPMVHAWSEPPVASIGLGVGTLASYVRPLQHIAYYEIDPKVVDLSLPPPGRETYFTYLDRAIRRGANLELIMGDARLSVQQERAAFSSAFRRAEDVDAGIALEQRSEFFPGRNRYYKIMEVSAFNSDAVPVHLLTKQAIELYMSKLADDGVLCLNASNRHLDLIQVAADICAELKLKYRVGRDLGQTLESPIRGHFASWYVMVARDEKWLPQEGAIPLGNPAARWVQQWQTPAPSGRRAWTDDFCSILSILR